MAAAQPKGARDRWKNTVGGLQDAMRVQAGVVGNIDTNRSQMGAIIFVAVAITATAIEMTRKEEAPASSPASLQQALRDPLREGQRRCQQLGQKAAEDSECMRVWAETRDRFLDRTPAPSSPLQIEGR